MNLSLNWLRRYLSVDLPVDRISEILTDIGLEVEGVDMVESIKGGLEGIVVGHVLSCESHPNADKLNLTQVDIGEENPCLLYTSPSPRDATLSRMPSSA